MKMKKLEIIENKKSVESLVIEEKYCKCRRERRKQRMLNIMNSNINEKSTESNPENIDPSNIAIKYESCEGQNRFYGNFKRFMHNHHHMRLKYNKFIENSENNSEGQFNQNNEENNNMEIQDNLSHWKKRRMQHRLWKFHHENQINNSDSKNSINGFQYQLVGLGRRRFIRNKFRELNSNETFQICENCHKKKIYHHHHRHFGHHFGKERWQNKFIESINESFKKMEVK